MADVQPAAGVRFDAEAEVAVIGGGACGLVAALLVRLLAAAAAAGADLVTGAHVTTLYAETDGRIAGIAIERHDGGTERLGCRALVIACNGYGANPDLVAGYIPEMAGAPYFGHPGNTGDALLWGQALGTATDCSE